jgi:hypothetical protein
MKYGQKLKLGDSHVTPRNIQDVQTSKLGDAPRQPFFIGKNQVTFQDTIFLLLRILCVFLGASLFSLSVFFCFVCCNTSREKPTADAPNLLTAGELQLTSDTNADGNALSLAHCIFAGDNCTYCRQ